jgi:hypothetical protein
MTSAPDNASGRQDGGGGATGIQVQDLEKSVTHLLEEGRMLLPGIQAIFGFQLIAVFNAVFYERLTHHERVLHLAAIALVATCMALVLAPAAYHRQAEPRAISERFLAYSSCLLAVALALLMCAVAMDVYLVSRAIVADRAVCGLIAGVVFAIFAILWFVVPWLLRRR